MEPIENIPCQQSCEAGYYLKADNLNRTFQCEKCPADHYSTGGGLLIDGKFGQWLNALRNNSDFMMKT